MSYKKKNAMFGRYPSCDMLNNAIRFIAKGDSDAALVDIIYAIQKADGYFHEDLKDVVENALKRYWEENKEVSERSEQ